MQPGRRHTELLRRLPSLKALLFFNVVAKHLNLVRAGEELNLTQGALSRQLKALEAHLGVELFRRGPRGLSFTQEGEILYDYSRRAFDTLGAGLGHLSVVSERESLVISAARSFAVRVLAPRIHRFLAAHPWADLRIDVHRYYADLESSGADISIRLGNGEWSSYRMQPLTDDIVWAVTGANRRAPSRISRAKPNVLLRNAERDYWDDWLDRGLPALVRPDLPMLHFNDSATMLAALEASGGLCLTRACLVRDAVTAGRLARLGTNEMQDGLRYYAVCAPRSGGKQVVDLFMQWLEAELPQA